MSDLETIRIKKYISQMKFLQNEYDEADILIKIYLKEFNEYFKDEIDSYMKRTESERLQQRLKEIDEQMKEQEKKGNLSNLNDTSNQDEKPNLDEIPKSDEKPELNDNIENNIENKSENESRKQNDSNLKKIYYLITLSTHPDKTSDKLKNMYFLKADKSYKDNDLLSLLVIMNDLNLDFNLDLSAEELSLIENNISDFKNKIDDIKKQNAWIWKKGTNSEKAHLKKQLYNYWRS